MTITTSDLGWGGYGGLEGPYFLGRLKYVVPVQPDFMDKALCTVTATEGGFDAVNMYDRCIVSIGLIQLCEATSFSASTLLGRCADMDSFMMDSYVRKFPVTIEFKKNAKGLYRFFYNGLPVETADQQRALFLGGSTGAKDSWTPENKMHAKDVAVWFANVWDYPLFCRTQAEFLKLRLPNYVMAESQSILFKNMRPSDQFSWAGAMRAAFYSYACNLPSVANKSLLAATKDWWVDMGDEEKCLIALQHLTFGPSVGIYPGRYNKIAPVLNRLFGVQLPLTADLLKAAKTSASVAPVPLTEPEQCLLSRAGSRPEIKTE